MNSLYLLRGCPGSGKSTWIEECKLQLLTISSDKLRLLFPCSINENGETVISQIYDTKVWKLLFELVEERMKVEAPVIVDATHYKGSFIKAYDELCKKYNYTIKIVDFPIPLEKAKLRNSMRPPLSRVPDAVIEKMYATLQMNQKEMKSKYQFVSKDEAVSQIMEAQFNSQPKDLTLDQFNTLCKNIKVYSRREDKRPVIAELCKYFPEYKSMINFDQDNKYHNMTLDNHCWEVCKNIPDTFDGLLFFAGLFHDIGKPLVAQKGKDGYTHFYDHARIGALLFQDKMSKTLLKAGVDPKDIGFIKYLIKSHDDMINDNFVEDKRKKGLNDYQIHSLLVLQYADAIAHVQEEKTIQRAKICLEQIGKLTKTYKG